MDTVHTIIAGDARNLKHIKDRTVHLTVTSPPYWQLKDYKTTQQIGYHDDYKTYIQNLNRVWRETYRTLHPGCRMCVNIGDQFARSVHYGKYCVLPIRSEIIRFCLELGFDYMGAIIWQKRTTTNTSGGGAIMGSYPYPRNGILKIDYEFILIFKKPGTAPIVSKAIKERSKLSIDDWKSYFSGHWHIPGIRQKDHLAAFPIEIPYRLIRMFSFVGDTVLDPFAGSGTTNHAAAMLERHSVACEIDEQMCHRISERLAADTVRIIREKTERPLTNNFQDTKVSASASNKNTFDRIIDPKRSNFGSRIDQKSQPRERYFRIRRIKSPTEMILNNGKHISLLGLKAADSDAERIIKFLHGMTKGKRIFLRFDENFEHQYAYVYLENKTFINAHLIKNKLMIVDESLEFRFKKRFLRYQKQNL